jgi:MSHA biogenesis protein MshQ
MTHHRHLWIGLASLLLLIGWTPARAVSGNQPLYLGNSLSGLSASAVSSVTITAPSMVIPGDLMLAFISEHVAGGAGTAPSGWTLITGSNSTALTTAAYYRVATAADVGGSTSYKWTLSSSGLAAGTILVFSGVSSTSPIETSGLQTNAASKDFTAPAITYNNVTTWVGLYAMGDGNTSGSDFTTPYYSTQAVDAGTQGGTSGVLLGAFYQSLSGYCSSGPCTSVAWIGSSTTNTSAISVGVSIGLIGATPAPMALYHLDETSWSGTSGEVIDASGNGYNGVAVNGATTAGAAPALTGANGTCFYGTFNGSTQYVQLPAGLPHINKTVTITAWIYPTATTGIGRIFADDSNSTGYALSYGDSGHPRVRLYSRNPSQVITDSVVNLSANQWYFVVAIIDAVDSGDQFLFIFNTSGAQVDAQGSTIGSTFSAGNGTYITIGGDATSANTGGIYRFPGNIDEVTVYPAALNYGQGQALALATHPCAAAVPNHYAVSSSGSAVNCTPAPVAINAHLSTHALLATSDTITLGTSSGHGDWTLTTGGGSFTAGAANSGTASYSFVPADNGTVVLALRDTYAETLTINVTDGTVTAKSGTALGTEDSPLTFAPTGFRITNGSNVAATIGTQVAGLASTQSLALQAVRTDTNTGACTTVFASGATVNVSMGFQCNNPLACVSGQSFTVTNNGTSTAIASNPATGISNYTTVALKFSTANAEAPITVNYSDVGQVTLAAKYNIPLGNGNPSANTMYGAGQFVEQPAGFTLTNIKATASGTANPAASTASGTVFLAAGQPFSAAVTAVNYAGAATPNFGQETSPATVTLTPTLVLPASGHDPAIGGGFGAFSAGAASGTAFSWPEVGIITITPGTGNYLGTGNVLGAATGNVGRFIPNAFAVALNTPLFATACAAGSVPFTYVGQPFTYAVAPVITVTAQALGGATTQNYAATLFRLTNASLTGRTYTPTPSSPGLTLTGLPASTTDPAIVATGLGTGTLTFSAGSGITFTRGSPLAPFNANIALAINVIDLDGVAATNPVTFGAGSGIGFSTGASQYYGRLALRDALGSELLDLPMTLSTQYYVNSTVGFTTNIADACTTAPAIAFSNYQLNLAAGETCVRDSGTPGYSGSGCAAAASGSVAYRSTASAGGFNLTLAAPGTGDNGAVTVTGTAPAWLQYLWNAASGGNSNPTGIATFGVFSGPPARIYQREVY